MNEIVDVIGLSEARIRAAGEQKGKQWRLMLGSKSRFRFSNVANGPEQDSIGILRSGASKWKVLYCAIRVLPEPRSSC